jgi:hypothetical protein
MTMVNRGKKRNLINPLNRKPRVWIPLLVLLWSLLICARTRISMLRFPADPGYDLVRQALTMPGIQIFSTHDWPYFYVIPRMVIEIVALFPLPFHGVVLALFINFVWVLCAIVVCGSITSNVNQKFYGAVAGTLVILNPMAMESSLGSYGNVKWPLTIAITCWFTSPRLINKYFRLLVLLTFLIGMSTPMLVFCISPILLLAKTNQISKCRTMLILLTVAITTFCQLKIAGGIENAAKGWGDRRVFKLNGLGIFWLFGQLGPVLISLFLIAVLAALGKKQRNDLVKIYGLIVTTLCLSASSFYLGGVADRYFVAPFGLATIALIQLYAVLNPKISTNIAKLKAIVLIFFLFTPSVKWFNAGWYLTTGPTWQSEAQRAQIECEQLDLVSTILEISAKGTTELECEVLNPK